MGYECWQSPGSVGPKIHFRSDKDVGQGRSVVGRTVENQGLLGKMNKKVLLTEEDQNLFGESPPPF